MTYILLEIEASFTINVKISQEHSHCDGYELRQVLFINLIWKAVVAVGALVDSNWLHWILFLYQVCVFYIQIFLDLYCRCLSWWLYLNFLELKPLSSHSYSSVVPQAKHSSFISCPLLLLPCSKIWIWRKPSSLWSLNRNRMNFKWHHISKKGPSKECVLRWFTALIILDWGKKTEQTPGISHGGRYIRPQSCAKALSSDVNAGNFLLASIQGEILVLWHRVLFKVLNIY